MKISADEPCQKNSTKCEKEREYLKVGTLKQSLSSLYEQNNISTNAQEKSIFPDLYQKRVKLLSKRCKQAIEKDKEFIEKVNRSWKTYN